MPALGENQRFERYRIIRYLGSGVSGESYEAEDTMLQRKVTLKLIHPWAILVDAARRQFFREMQNISQLNHPYLAAILDYGEVNDRLYVVRRYVTSGSLLSSDGRLWFQPPFSVSNAISYGHQLAQALEHIHRHDCLHGALTLSNILVLRGANSDNAPNFAPFLLADVGLANFVRRFGQPQAQLLPITAAPEQLGKRVTPASDQFALAVLIYFWLAGRPPYLGSPEEIEHLKLTETITPLSSLNSNITFEQETILHRALAVYPEERFPSMIKFADALLATLIPPPYETPSPQLTSQPATPLEFVRVPETDPASLLESLPHEEQQLADENLPEPEIIPLAEEQAPLTFEPEPLLDVESQTGLAFEEIPHAEPLLSNQADLAQQPAQPTPEVLMQNEPSLQTDSEQQPLPQPAPEPLPIPAPEPLPQPTPVPLPQPSPEPSIQPEPIPLPQPDPDPLPQPAPDIYQPLPQPATEPAPMPQTDTPSAASESPETQELLAIQPSQPLLSPRLIINFSGGGEPYEFTLEREETSLGRAGSDDVLLDQDTSISRHHALVRHDDGRYVIYDQRSASGVFVNGQKLADDAGRALVDGDSINIGSYELLFRRSIPTSFNKAVEVPPDTAIADNTKVGISS